MNIRQFLYNARHARTSESPIEITAGDTDEAQPVRPAEIRLPFEATMPSLGGATAWLNSPPLSAADLGGKVVLVDFWTYTCVNWLRTLPYVRAWVEKYKEHGVVVIGVHTPEFPFEHDIENVRRAAQEMRVGYPIAVDSDYAIWDAFANHYWLALYLVDTQGHLRYHHFGEGAYELSERVLQHVLAEARIGGFAHELVSVDVQGAEVAAEYGSLRSPETYTGDARTEHFASPGGAVLDRRHVYAAPEQLRLNHWVLAGEWTVGRGNTLFNEANGRIAYRFHARDVNLVMGPAARGTSVRFRVFLDGQAPGEAHGSDVDEQGNGTVSEQRLYQLIRQPGHITDRQFEIEFLDAGVEAFVFTFG